MQALLVRINGMPQSIPLLIPLPQAIEDLFAPSPEELFAPFPGDLQQLLYTKDDALAEWELSKAQQAVGADAAVNTVNTINTPKVAETESSRSKEGKLKTSPPSCRITERNRKIRQLQAENIRLSSLAQEYEGQAWDATNLAKHRANQLESLTTMNLATIRMVAKLREEIWELRFCLDEEQTRRSMERMNDLYSHPDNEAIALQLMDAVHQIHTRAEADDEEQVEKLALPRGGSTSPLSSW
ncbi:hypothetical protein C8J56DRAFT_898266 [Mycena floridula]|nr:hypothetical protein C8J56DRAFT_898266 [Mycena floridula]